MEEQRRLLAEERAMVRERDAQAQAKCFEFRSVVSACVKDSDCTSVEGVACWELVISKARLPEALAIRQHGCATACPASGWGEISSSIPICEQQRCVWRSSQNKLPMDTCLDRHLERFPTDKTPIVVELSRQANELVAVAAGDDREVARCLEDRMIHVLSRRSQAASVKYTPGPPHLMFSTPKGPAAVVSAPVDNVPTVTQPIVVPTTTKGTIQKQVVRPDPASGN